MSGLHHTPEQKIRQRHNWFLEADRLGNVRLACRRLGISCKTLYKGKKRFLEAKGERSALRDRSRRPHPPRCHVKKGLIRRLLALRQETHLGPSRRAAPAESGSQEDPLCLPHPPNLETGRPDP
jgi:hypothetical protein